MTPSNEWPSLMTDSEYRNYPPAAGGTKNWAVVAESTLPQRNCHRMLGPFSRDEALSVLSQLIHGRGEWLPLGPQDTVLRVSDTELLVGHPGGFLDPGALRRVVAAEIVRASPATPQS